VAGRPRRGPCGWEAPRERASKLPGRLDRGAGKSWYVRVILMEVSVGLEVVDLVVRFWSCGLEVLSFVGKDWRYMGGLGSSSV
jgi:hypothetical protein